jgi:ABC-2 type transport system permease protein
VNGALVYLTLRSTRNRILFRLRRLRQPRYALASCVGVLYYFMVFRPGSASRVFSYGADSAPVLEVAASMTVFIAASLAWLFPGSRTPALTFTRADVQWLFPAPISRRQLLYYRLFSSQPALIASSLLLTLFMGPTNPGGAFRFFAGMWLLETTVGAHLSGVSLGRRSLGAHGLAGFSRQWAPVAIVAIAALVFVTAVARGWPEISSSATWRDGAVRLQQLLSSGAAAFVLWPARALVRVPLAASASAFAAALPAALAMLALNLAWVIRSDAAFEEASAERAEKVAARLAAMRGQGIVVRPSDRRRSPFTLASTGRTEIAFLWKNLILLSRQSRAMYVVMLLPIVMIGVIVAMGGRSEIADLVAIACVAVAPMLLLVGPMAMRNDLRQDLAHLATLKTWPVRGAAIVRGELLAPTLTLSVALAALVAAAATLVSREMLDLLVGPGVSRLTLAVAAILIASAVAAVQVVVQNALALAFPAWSMLGDARPGVEMLGQNMLLMVASMLALLLSILPAVLIGAAAAAVVGAVAGSIPVLFAVIVGTLVVTAECAIAVQILGRVLDRTDLSEVAPLH